MGWVRGYWLQHPVMKSVNCEANGKVRSADNVSTQLPHPVSKYLLLEYWGNLPVLNGARNSKVLRTFPSREALQDVNFIRTLSACTYI